MKNGRPLPEVLAELQRQNNAKQDYIAPAASLTLEPDGQMFSIGADHTFATTSLFHRQIASALNIPPVYIEGIGGWEKGSDVRARTYDHTISVEDYKYSKLYSDKISTLLGENIPRNTPRKSAEA